MSKIETQIDIEDAEIEVPKEKKRKRLRYTNLFFTINTNKSYNEMDERRQEVQKQFVNALRELLTPDTLGEYIIFNEKFKQHQYTPEFFRSVKIQIVPEFGPQRGFLHLHGVIQISHYSGIHFNFMLLKQRLIEKLGLENLYLQYKLFFDTKANILDYIHKTRFFKK